MRLRRLLVLLILTIFFFKCSKQNFSELGEYDNSLSNPDTNSNSTSANFNADSIAVFKNEFYRQANAENFLNDFLNWHGNPNFDKTISLSNDTGKIWLVPVIKSNQQNTNAFIVCKRNGNAIVFELHRLSSVLSDTYEPSVFLSDSAVRYVFKYFDYTLFQIKKFSVDKPIPYFEFDTLNNTYKKTGNYFFKNPSFTSPCTNCLVQSITTCEDWYYDPDGDADPLRLFG